MKKQYLIRLDDACPTMSHEKWSKIEEILDHYQISPLVGIIPCNRDSHLEYDNTDSNFWNLVNRWEKKGWSIALHGYDHVYISSDSGINPMWPRSEFAGIDLAIQRDKIRKGVGIMREHGINPKYFFAPSHTYDNNTLQALKECSDIRIISDSIAINPYKYKDFIFIPQLGGHCFNIPFPGIWTFCLHPSEMNAQDFENLSRFLEANSKYFCNFEEINLNTVTPKKIVDKILSMLYFNYRRLRSKS